MTAQPASIAAAAMRAAIIRPLAEQGLTAAAIGKLTGASRCSVSGFCHRQGIKLLGKEKWNKAEPAAEVPKVAPVAPVVAPPQTRPNDHRKGRLTASGCRFPLWPHDALPNGRYCGEPVRAPGEPYCPSCAAICYQPYLAKLTAPSDGDVPKSGVGLRAGVQPE